MRKTPFAHIVIAAFWLNCIGPFPAAKADEWRLPAPGVMVPLSPPLDPPILKGIKVHPDNPFRFDFILDKGNSLQGDLKPQASRLVKYFLASLTVPEKDLWVNLSPYEKNRIVPQSFGRTEMGRDLLAEDYMLKQITASLIYPEGETGKKFWARVYAQAAQKFGTTNVPVNTFNKVWIVPEKAVVYENAKAGTAYIVDSKLKVMLEEDYLSLNKHMSISQKMASSPSASRNDTGSLGSQIIREIVIPELTREVNEDKNFAQLRQVYNSIILAAWYKKKIKDSILDQVYADKNKIVGLVPRQGRGPDVEGIYGRYLQAFKKGVFNYIKEEQDSLTQEIIPRKYFSGGMAFNKTSFAMLAVDAVSRVDMAQLNSVHPLDLVVDLVIPRPAILEERKNDVEAQADTLLTKIQKAYRSMSAEEFETHLLRKDIFIEYAQNMTPDEAKIFAERLSKGWNNDEDLRRYGPIFYIVALSVDNYYYHDSKEAAQVQDWLYAFLSIASTKEQAVSLWLVLVAEVMHMKALGMHPEWQGADKYPVLHDRSTVFGNGAHPGVLARFMSVLHRLENEGGWGQMKDIFQWGIALACDPTIHNPAYVLSGFGNNVLALPGASKPEEFMRRSMRESFGHVFSYEPSARDYVRKALNISKQKWEHKGIVPPQDFWAPSYLAAYYAVKGFLTHMFLFLKSDDTTMMDYMKNSKDGIGNPALEKLGTLSGVYKTVWDQMEELLTENAAMVSLHQEKQKYRVMVIEHEPTLIPIYEKVLRDLGYQGEFYTNSQEGRDKFSANPRNYSLVIMDFNPGKENPHGNGVILARELAAIDPEINIFIDTAKRGEAKEANSPRLSNIKGIVGKLIERNERHDLMTLMGVAERWGYLRPAANAAMATVLPMPPSDVPVAQQVVRELSERANELYKIRNGPFTIQQYIPLTWRKPGVQEPIAADIHGGEALWLVVKDLIESPVFRDHFRFPAINANSNYREQLINVLYSQGLIKRQERRLLRQYIKDIDDLVRPFRGISFDHRGTQNIKDRDVRTSSANPDVDGFYKAYYQKTQFVYDVLTRGLKTIIGQALPTEYGESEPIAQGFGFVVRDLRQGFYIDFENQFHFKVKGEGRGMPVIDFPEHGLDRLLDSHPELLVKIFQWAAERDAVISDALINTMRERIARLPKAIESPQMQDAFLDLLKSRSKISLRLLKMYQMGLLGKFFPEFDDLKYHFEVPIHRFSVPVHTLYLFYFLEHLSDPSIAHGIHEDTIKTYNYVATNEDEYSLLLLRFALFFHDLQKQNERQSFSEPHPILGALNLVPRLLNQFSLSRGFGSGEQWLVWHHQELVNRTDKGLLYSDLLDFLKMGEGVLDEPLWDVLYLLSVADANSVDPYNSDWFVESGRQDTMREMFHIFLRYFQGTVSRGEFERAFTDGGEIFDWLMANGYFEEDSGDVVYAHVLTPQMETNIRNRFYDESNPNKAARILTILRKSRQATAEQKDKIKKEWEEKAKQETANIFATAERTILRQYQDNPEKVRTWISQYLSMFQPYYYRTMGGQNLAAQFKIFEQAASNTSGKFEAHSIIFPSKTAHGPMFEVSVAANKDQPGIFYKITGVLAALGFNVWDAKINTTEEGVVLGRFRGYFLPIEMSIEEHRWNELTDFLTQRISQLPAEKQSSPEFQLFASLEDEPELRRNALLSALIKLVLEGYINIDEVFKFNPSFVSAKRTTLGQPAAKISLDSPVGGMHTVLALQTDDRVGLLYMVSRILSQRFGLNIGEASVSTFQKGLEDTFALTSEGRSLKRMEGDNIAHVLENFSNRENITNDDIVAEATDKWKGDLLKGHMDSAMNSQLAENRALSLQESGALFAQGRLVSHIEITGVGPFNLIETNGLFRMEHNGRERIIDDSRAEGNFHPSPRRGGIDFTAGRTPLEIQNSGQGIKFHLNPVQLAQLRNAPGFTPVIVSMQPLADLKSFLGIVNQSE